MERLSKGTHPDTRPPTPVTPGLCAGIAATIGASWALLCATGMSSATLLSAEPTTRLQPLKLPTPYSTVPHPVTLRPQTVPHQPRHPNGVSGQMRLPVRRSTTTLLDTVWAISGGVVTGLLFAAATARGLRRPHALVSMATVSATTEARQDDVLPDGVEDAVARASRAALQAIAEGQNRCIAEVNLENTYDVLSGPQFSEPGAAARWLRLSHDFAEAFVRDGGHKVVAVFPDTRFMGLMLKEYPTPGYGCVPLALDAQDKILGAGATAVVFIAPDVDDVSKIFSLVDALGPTVPAIIFNPRIGDFAGARASGGQQFGDRFLTAYSMRYVRDVGAIFRCYPDPWKVFKDDPQAPGRYVLVTTLDRRPAIWELDYLLTATTEGAAPPTLDSEEDQEEGSSVVGYSLLYGLSAVPVLIVIGVTIVLFINSVK